MESEERPRARPLEPIPVEIDNQQVIVLRDPLKLIEDVIVTPVLYFFLAHCDGEHSIADIKLAFFRQFQHILTEEETNHIFTEMDQHLLLDNERSRAHSERVIADWRCETVRPAAHQGQAYPDDPDRLREEFDAYYATNDELSAVRDGKALRGLIAPHISISLGAACFASAYRRLREAPPADTYVILGTGHAQIDGYFAATRKAFETPLGQLEVDAEFLDRLEAHFGGDLCEQEIHHRGEHVIEFQVVFLQHALAGRAARIVPILCSFSPEQLTDGDTGKDVIKTVDRFCDALRKTIDESDGSVCVIASADLAHVGFRYGDRVMYGKPELEQVECDDRAMIDIVCTGDAEGFVRNLMNDHNRRRICGFPCIYPMLRALELENGELLRYDQSAMDERGSTVSYASIAFYD